MVLAAVAQLIKLRIWSELVVFLGHDLEGFPRFWSDLVRFVWMVGFHVVALVELHVADAADVIGGRLVLEDKE